MLHFVVIIEQPQACISVEFLEKIAEFLATSENAIEFIVAESYATIVLNSAAIVDLIDISPQTRT